MARSTNHVAHHCYLFSLKSKFFLSTLFSSNLTLCCSSGWQWLSHWYKTTDRLTIMYILSSGILRQILLTV